MKHYGVFTEISASHSAEQKWFRSFDFLLLWFGIYRTGALFFSIFICYLPSSQLAVYSATLISPSHSGSDVGLHFIEPWWQTGGWVTTGDMQMEEENSRERMGDD